MRVWALFYAIVVAAFSALGDVRDKQGFVLAFGLWLFLTVSTTTVWHFTRALRSSSSAALPDDRDTSRLTRRQGLLLLILLVGTQITIVATIMIAGLSYYVTGVVVVLSLVFIVLAVKKLRWL